MHIKSLFNIIILAALLFTSASASLENADKFQLHILPGLIDRFQHDYNQGLQSDTKAEGNNPPNMHTTARTIMRSEVTDFSRAQLSAYRFPAEFEPQSAVWISWPNWQGVDPSGIGYLDEAQVAIGMLKALTPHVTVKLVVDSRTSFDTVKEILLRNNVPLDNVSFQILPYMDIGTRDWGPIYVVNKNGDKKIIHFDFTYWGLPQYADPKEMKLCDKFASQVAKKDELDLVEANMVSEGGDRSFNGKGTMMAIEHTELQRNSGMTKAQLETKYKDLLGVKKVIWLKRGVVDDSEPNEAAWIGPDGVTKNAYAIGAEHVDEVAHFADAHTILLAWVTEEEANSDPIKAIDRQRLLENYQILKVATDQDGKLFKIIRVPVADTVYYKLTSSDDLYQWLSAMSFEDGSAFPAPDPVYELAATSYMNIMVSNGVVVVPQYWEPGKPDGIKQKDDQVMAIMKDAFPGREIVGVDPLAYNIGSGGGMHCSFQQEPGC